MKGKQTEMGHKKRHVGTLPLLFTVALGKKASEQNLGARQERTLNKLKNDGTESNLTH